MYEWIEKARVIVITCSPAPFGRGHEEIAVASLEAGCLAVQLRDKEISDRKMAIIARNLMPQIRKKGALLFINDRVDVAAVVGADGVHLGVEDIEVKDARKILGPGAIIGYSPDSVEDAKEAVAQGADYLGVGPVYGTSTKSDAGDAIGLDGILQYVREFDVPIIAVGSIDAGRAAEVIRAGATGVAVCSAVCNAPFMVKATESIMEAVRSNLRRSVEGRAPDDL